MAPIPGAQPATRRPLPRPVRNDEESRGGGGGGASRFVVMIILVVVLNLLSKVFGWGWYFW